MAPFQVWGRCRWRYLPFWEKVMNILFISLGCDKNLVESVGNILEMAEYKKNGRAKALIVTGCLAERYREEIQKEIPEVDVVLGTTAHDKIVEAIEAALEGKRQLWMEDLKALPRVGAKRQVTTGGHYA